MLSTESPFFPLSTDRVLLETEYALSFLDKYPVARGHALVVPKTVDAGLFHLSPREQAGVWDAVRQVRELLVERYHPSGFNIGINDGVSAGQTMMHAHVHVIPRYPGDCDDPRGGIRWIVPAKAVYWKERS